VKTKTPAHFLFDYPPHKDTFVIKLRDADRIAEARRIVAGTPSGGTHVGGVIVKEPAPYNQPWSYPPRSVNDLFL
jgi:hypothetical protein